MERKEGLIEIDNKKQWRNEKRGWLTDKAAAGNGVEFLPGKSLHARTCIYLNFKIFKLGGRSYQEQLLSHFRSFLCL